MWRSLVPLLLTLLLTVPSVQAQNELRGSGDVIPSFTPSDADELERLARFIHPNGFDIDRVHETAESPAVRRTLVELAAEVLRHFPPSEFDYVSLGRSPAPVAIVIEEILRERGSQARLIELPMSGLRHDDMSFEPEWYRKALRAHFEKFFFQGPSESGRKVLILDYVQRGGTLSNFASILAYGQEEGWIQREVHILALLNPNVDPRALWLQVYSKNRDRFPQSRWHAMALPQTMWPYFIYNSWKHLAKFDGWNFRDLGYEENVKSQRWGTAMPGSNRRVRREIPEPRVPSPRLTERRSIWKFWNNDRTERETFAEEVRPFLDSRVVHGGSIKICGRVHRTD